MPFVHPKRKKEPWFKAASSQSHRNGWRCKIFSSEKCYYKGNWEKSYSCGKGVELSPSGIQYEGDWVYNKKNGFGILSKFDEKNKTFGLVYIGDFKNNKKHGLGSLHYEDGTFYEGEFKHDKRQGFGKCWFTDSSYYEGYWVKDLQHGYGLFVLANGNRYEGEWSNGKKNGFGEFYHLSTSQRQVGYWVNEVCITSQIEDIRFRQSALFPTPYPIVKTILNPATLSFFNSAENIINDHHKNWKFLEKCDGNKNKIKKKNPCTTD